jgi:TetR/AcrR family transcriptional regulator, fatty acid metabolism regulator protein
MPKLTNEARRALIERRKSQILAAAARVFARKGYERATIADIAKVARVAEGSIYNYFKNKQDLLVSLPRQLIEPAIEASRARVSTNTFAEPLPPEEILSNIAHSIIFVIRANAHVIRALVSALPNMKQPLREKYLQQVILYVTGLLKEYFQQQIEQGNFRQGLNPETLSLAFVGLFFPVVMFREVLQVETERNLDYDQLIDEVVSVFLRGVLAEPSEGKRR